MDFEKALTYIEDTLSKEGWDDNAIDDFIGEIRGKLPALSSIPAAPVEAMQKEPGKVVEFDYKEMWLTLKAWLNTDSKNGSGHKVARALYLMDELETEERRLHAGQAEKKGE